MRTYRVGDLPVETCDIVVAADRYTLSYTIPIPPDKRDARFTVVSVATLLAEGIARVHDGRSVSELFG